MSLSGMFQNITLKENSLIKNNTANIPDIPMDYAEDDKERTIHSGMRDYVAFKDTHGIHTVLSHIIFVITIAH